VPSSRLPADLGPNAVTQAVAAALARGTPLADLTESNPTRVGVAYPAGLLDPLADARGLAYDPQPMGLPSAREAVAGELERRGLRVDPGRIALTASTSESYSLLFKLLCDAGDDVLVPQPSYPLFEHLASLEAVRAVPYTLEYHGGWRIDMPSLERACTRRARAVLVVSPNNPTGAWLHRDDLAALAALCASHGMALIGDEVFADYPLDDAPHKASVLDQQDVLTFALGGLSKSVGLPQVKLGWIAAAGPAAAVSSALRAYEVAADTYLSVSTPVQIAAPMLLQRGAVVRAALHARVRRNLDTLRALAASVPAAPVLPGVAGWAAPIRVPALRSEEALVLELIQRDGVLVHPGYFFDWPREAFLIVSLLVPPVLFDDAIVRVLGRAVSAEAPL
jgi:aspartate/methionine/tyrosine aminotransferase